MITGQERPSVFVEITVDDVEPRWSSVDYGRNFLSAKEAYWGVSREKTRSGTLVFGNSGRFLSWEVSAGLVYLREYSLQGDLSDSALIISFGEFSISAACIFDESVDSKSIAAECRFFLKDLSVVTLSLRSNITGLSVLADFVQQSRGALFDASVAGLRSNRIHRLKISSISDERNVFDACWVSVDLLLIASSKGTILAVSCSDLLLLRERYMSDYGALTSFLTGITGVIGFSDKPDILAVGGDEELQLSVDAAGTLRIWNDPDANCIFQQNMETAIQEASISHSMFRAENLLFVAIAYRIPCTASQSTNWAVQLLSFTINLKNRRIESVLLKNHYQFSFDPQSNPEEVPGWFKLGERENFDSSVIYEIQSADVGFSHTEKLLLVNWKIKRTMESDSGVLVLTVDERLTKYSLMDPDVYSAVQPSYIENFKDRLNYLLAMEDQDAANSYLPHDETDEEATLKAMMARMLKRIFYPGRFTADVIRITLQKDIPYDVQTHVSSMTFVDLSERVLVVCREWAKRLSEYLNSDFISQGESLRRVFCSFLELCERRRKQMSLLSDQSLSKHCLASSDLPTAFVMSRNLGLSFTVPLQMVDSFCYLDNSRDFFTIVREYVLKPDNLGNTVSRKLDVLAHEVNIRRSDSLEDVDCTEILTDVQRILGEGSRFSDIKDRLVKCYRERNLSISTILDDIEMIFDDIDSCLNFSDNDILKAAKRAPSATFVGECSTSLFGKITQLFVISKNEVLKVIVAGLALLRDFEVDSWIESRIPLQSVSRLLYTSFITDLISSNTLLQSNSRLAPAIDQTVDVTRASITLTLRAWDPPPVRCTNSQVPFVSLWSKLWTLLTPRVVNIWSVFGKYEGIYDQRYLPCLMRGISRLLKPSFVNDIFLGLKEINEPVWAHRCLSAISFCCETTRQAAPSNTLDSVIFSWIKSFSSHHFFASRLRRANLDGTLSKYDDTFVQQLQDVLFHSLHQDNTNFANESFGVSELQSEDDVDVFESIEIWVRSCNDAESRQHRLNWDQIIIFGDFIYKASLSPEMSKIFRPYNDGRIDALVQDFPSLLVIFCNLENLLACARDIEYLFGSDTVHVKFHVLCIFIWERYLDQVQNMEDILSGRFQSTDFSFIVIDRRRKALGELVKHNLLLQDFDRAYNSLEHMLMLENVSKDPDEQWRLCIHNMVLHACDNGRIEFLCGLTDIFVKDVSLFDTFFSELISVADQSDVLRGLTSSDDECSYYEVILALLIKYKDFEYLAERALDFRDRLIADVNNEIVLPFTRINVSICVHALSCLAPEHAYALRRGRTTLYSSVKCIQAEFVSATCRRLIGSHEDVNCFQLIEKLLHAHALDEAVGLVIVHDNHAQVEHNTPIDEPEVCTRIIETLAKFCAISNYHQEISSKIFQRLNFSNRYSRPTRSFGALSPSDDPWDFPLDFLLTLQMYCPEKFNKISVYNTFCERMFRQECESEPEFENIPLPLRYIYATENDRKVKGGDLRFYVRMLIESGMLSEACSLTESFFADLTSTTSNCDIPYNVVDRLICTCDRVLNSEHARLNVQQDSSRLRVSKRRLEEAIRQYFNRQVRPEVSLFYRY